MSQLFGTEIKFSIKMRLYVGIGFMRQPLSGATEDACPTVQGPCAGGGRSGSHSLT